MLLQRNYDLKIKLNLVSLYILWVFLTLPSMGSGKNKQARASSILMNKEQVTSLRELAMDKRGIRERKKRTFCSEDFSKCSHK